MKPVPSPHTTKKTAPASRWKKIFAEKEPSGKKVIRKIILLFGLLVTAIIGNTIYTTYQ